MSVLPINEVCARVSLSERTVRRLVREGRFPRPVWVADRRIGWRDADIDAWIMALDTVTAEDSSQMMTAARAKRQEQNA